MKEILVAGFIIVILIPIGILFGVVGSLIKECLWKRGCLKK